MPEQNGTPPLPPDIQGDFTQTGWGALRRNADQAWSAPRPTFTTAAALLAVSIAALAAVPVQAATTLHVQHPGDTNWESSGWIRKPTEDGDIEHQPGPSNAQHNQDNALPRT
eukprot:4459233-Heterocapsa_arctica.AAC.1